MARSILIIIIGFLAHPPSKDLSLATNPVGKARLGKDVCPKSLRNLNGDLNPGLLVLKLTL